MPDFLEAGRQDILEEATEELYCVQGHLPRLVRSDAAMGKSHLAIVARNDSMVAHGDAEDARGGIP